MAVVIGLLIALEAVAVVMLAAAFGFELPAVAHFGTLLDRGPPAADLLRWGALLDVGGYLAFGLLILYVGNRLWPGRELVVAALTASGMSAVLVGGTGAALLATVGPTLVGDGQASTEAAGESTRLALEVLGRAVSAGMWGTVVFGLLGAWLAGVGWLTRQATVSASVALIAGAGMIASSVRTSVTGRVLADVAGPVDSVVVAVIVVALSLFFVWLLWLAARLWRGAGINAA